MAGACGTVCYEVDPEAATTEERLVYAGVGKGNYKQVSSLELVGRGKGDFEKEQVIVSQGYRLNKLFAAVSCALAIGLLLLLSFANSWWQPRAADAVDECRPQITSPLQKEMCCRQGYQTFCDRQPQPVQSSDRYFSHVKALGAPHVPKYTHQEHLVPVPEPSEAQYHSVIKVPSPMLPQSIVKNKVIAVQHVYDCTAGFSNWNSGWSSEKKVWCCEHQQRGCPGSHTGHLTKTVVTGVSTHEGPTYYHHAESYGDESYGDTVLSGLSGGSWSSHLSGFGSDSGWHNDLHDKAPRRLQAYGESAMDVPSVHEAVGAQHEASQEGGAVVVGGAYDASAIPATEVPLGQDHVHVHYVPTPVPAPAVHATHHYVSSPVPAVHVTHYVPAPAPAQVTHHYVTAPAVHVTHHYVPAPAPEPHVKTIVHKHYRTVYRKVPVNHYVHVQMPENPPIVHTVQVQTPAKTYDCDGVGGSPDPSWSQKHTRWCCYKYRLYCPKRVVEKNIYHTVVKTQEVKVPVPEPMPTHPPIVKTVKHTYHVPSPPKYVHVHEPGPTVVKPVVVKQKVPVPVPQPPQVIKVKKPYTVHLPGKTHYVHVPIPSPPRIVTRYHTKWNTVVDRGAPLYDCQADRSHWKSLWSHAKSRWCCTHKSVGCLGSSGTIGHSVTVHHYHTVHTVHTVHHKSDWSSHGWHAFHA